MIPKVDPTGLQQSLWWLPGCQVATYFEGPFRGVSIGGRMRRFHRLTPIWEICASQMGKKICLNPFWKLPRLHPKRNGSKTDHRPPPNYEYIIGIQCFETSQSLVFVRKESTKSSLGTDPSKHPTTTTAADQPSTTWHWSPSCLSLSYWHGNLHYKFPHYVITNRNKFWWSHRWNISFKADREASNFGVRSWNP